MITIREDEWSITIRDTPEMKEQIFQEVVNFLKDHRSWSAESVMQYDAVQIDATDLLADIVDIIKPEINDSDDNHS